MNNIAFAMMPLLALSLAVPDRVIDDAEKGISTLETRCRDVDRNPESGSGSVFECYLKREGSDRRLIGRAVHVDGDPFREAKRAGDAGDFRFMGYSMIVPGIFPAAYGIACKPSIVSQGFRMVRAVYTASDLPTTSKVEADKLQLMEENRRRFGEKYNSVLLADRRSPFRKICRTASRDLERGNFRPD